MSFDMYDGYYSGPCTTWYIDFGTLICKRVAGQSALYHLQCQFAMWHNDLGNESSKAHADA